MSGVHWSVVMWCVQWWELTVYKDGPSLEYGQHWEVRRCQPIRTRRVKTQVRDSRRLVGLSFVMTGWNVPTSPILPISATWTQFGSGHPIHVGKNLRISSNKAKVGPKRLQYDEAASGALGHVQGKNGE